jgi:hypothetical protein
MGIRLFNLRRANIEKARLHVEAGGSASRPWPIEAILISILFEQEKALGEFESKKRDYGVEERAGVSESFGVG